MDVSKTNLSSSDCQSTNDEFNDNLMTVVYDENLNIVDFINPQHSLMLRHTEKELIGLNVHELPAFVEEANRVPALTISKNVEKALLSDKCIYFEYVTIRENNTPAYAVCFAKKHPDNRLYVQVLETNEDDVYDACESGFFSYINQRQQDSKLIENQLVVLKSIYANLPVGLCIYNKVGKIISVSDSYLTLFGLKGKHSLHAPCDFDDPCYPKWYRAKMDKGEKVEFRVEYDFDLVQSSGYMDTVKSGKSFLLVKSTGIFSDTGVVLGYLEIVEDITGQVIEENQLAEMQSDLELSLSAGRISVWKYDVEHDIFRTIFGNTLSDSHHSLSEMETVLIHDDFVKLTNLMKELISGAKQRGSVTVRALTDTGDTCYYECEMEVRQDALKKVVCIVGTQHDITKKVYTATQFDYVQKSFDLVMEASKVISWSYDMLTKEKKILYGQRLLERHPLLHNHRQHVHLEDKENYDNLLLKVAKGEIDQASTIIRIAHEGDRTCFFESSFMGIKDENGKVFTLVGSLYDVSEHFEKQRELEMAYNFIDIAISTENMNTWVYDIKKKIFVVKQGKPFFANEMPYEFYFASMLPQYADAMKETLDSVANGEKDMASGFFAIKATRSNPIMYYQSFVKAVKDRGQVVSVLGITQNITELVEQKMIVEKSRVELNLALEAGDISAWVYDTDTRILSTLYGNTISGNGMTIEENYSKLHPDDVKMQSSMFADMENQKIDKAQMISRYRDESTNGGYRYYENKMISKKENGKVVLITGTQKDITNEYQKQLQLNEYFVKTKLVNEACHTIPWDYDPYNHIVSLFGNNVIVPYWQFGLEEFLSFVHPDDANFVRDIFEQLDKFELDSCKGIIRVKNVANDDYFTIEVDGIVVKDESGKGMKYTGIRRDISDVVALNEELKSSKERVDVSNQMLSEIIERIPGSFFIKDVDNDFRYVMANSTYCKTINMENSDIIGRTDIDIYEESVAKKYHDADKSLTKEGDLVSYESVFYVNNEILYWQVSKSFAKMIDGRNYIIGIATDVTQLRKINNELTEARKKAEEADKLKSAFLANMSHEIRTPLNAIVGFSDLLMETDDETERKEYCKIISNNNELLLNLIGDILDLSKIEAGTLDYKREWFDLSSYFHALTISFKQRNHNKDIEFIVENPYKSCYIYGDKNRMAQIVTNFVTNAFKYTYRGFIKVGYKIEKGGINLYVKDSGVGIPESKKSRVFHRFEKLDSFVQGNGLGLSIVKAIIEASGGQVGFESKEGEGSTFWAWRPFDKIEVSYNDSTATSKEEKGMPDPHQNPKLSSILVAEDNDSNFLLLQHILKGVSLTRAKNGIEVVELAKGNKYEIILMDIKMPLMDGFEATKEIRKFNTSIPIIAVSAFAYRSDKEEAKSVGCNAFITKPVKKSELLDAISSLVQNKIITRS